MTVLIGSEIPAVVSFAAALQAELVGLPQLGDPDLEWAWAERLDEWRDEVAALPPADAIVVTAWTATLEAHDFIGLDLTTWLREGEQQLALWTAAMTAAVLRCRDGGVVIAVIERPAVLDSAGYAVRQMVADGIEVLVKSLARGEGKRGVRVNAVTTSARLAPPESISPPVPLVGFPGDLDVEVAGAVRALLGPGCGAITGRIVDVDFGRSWR